MQHKYPLPQGFNAKARQGKPVTTSQALAFADALISVGCLVQQFAADLDGPDATKRDEMRRVMRVAAAHIARCADALATGAPMPKYEQLLRREA